MEQNNVALLVMDVQVSTTKLLKNPTEYFQAINLAIKKARLKNIPIIYVVVGFRKGFPEVCPNNKSFSTLKSNPSMNLDNEEAFKVCNLVKPEPTDVIITKKRVSAFAGSDLEIVLLSMDIKHLVLTGISTSGVVLSTLREAADKDYKLTVLADCCADLDEEVQHVLTTKIFVRQAEVINAEIWLA